MNKLPHITPELISYLETLYPDTVPEPTYTDRDIWMRVGQVQLIRHLKRIAEEQRADILGGIEDVHGR